MAWTRVAGTAEPKDKGVIGVECAGEEIALYWIDGTAAHVPAKWKPVRR